ncbi:MAG: hypothetical protein AB1649_15125 [Chloroflexota bacterium]
MAQFQSVGRLFCEDRMNHSAFPGEQKTFSYYKGERLMNSKRMILTVISIVFTVLVICVGILLVEAQTKIARRWIDNVFYDNRNHYLPCEQLPPVSEVERIIQEHQEVIQQIEEVNPGLVGVNVNTCGAGQNADITFWYASHKDRIAIEQIIGSDTFFGVPYILNNR